VRLYDSRSQSTVDLVPLVDGEVGMYVCGPTVQSSPHIGHLRSALVYDLWRRWLGYRGYRVTLVRNVTDIDDKILVNASEDESWWALAYRYELEFTAGYTRLGILPPSYEPRATASIGQMQDIIRRLIDRGHAYPAPDGSGDVYFDTASWPQYGELTRQKADDMAPAEDADPRGKRDPRDFALWKGHKADEPLTASWPSPWGRGRPGWHIECSAMAGKYLGDAFDIHGGGVDLRFPHHENEQAQSRAAGFPFASYWLHNAWITTSGEKMSKSLGNSLLVPAVLEQVRGIELRYYMVAAHYRSTVEFSFEALAESAAAFRRIEGYLKRVADLVGPVGTAGVLRPEFVEAMDDDLGTPAAVAAIHDAVREGNKLLPEGDSAELRANAASVHAMLGVLGLDPMHPHWSADTGEEAEHLTHAVDVLVRGLLEQRAEARAAKDWATADAIRDRILAAGIEVEDTPDGPRWSIDGGS
jgi:cysteinyl-tRNA synthetase